MTESEYDPAHEVAGRLAAMDGPTRERTLRIFQDVLSKDAATKQCIPGDPYSGEKGINPEVGRLLTPDRVSPPQIVREARQKVRELESKMHDLRLRLGELHNLIRAFSD